MKAHGAQGNGSQSLKNRLTRASSLCTFFSPARQIPFTWLSLLLALFFLIMTVVYASDSDLASGLRYVNSSSSHTLFVLRVLSELTGLFLISTINATFERIQWLLVSRKDGLHFPKFLALNAGTGVLGILTILCGRCITGITPRLCSAVRLISVIITPILGVLILSRQTIFTNL